MKHLVLGTAGHIDHGKTSFIRALTGIDTDRLKEEKERGITIDIGFAHFTTETGDVLSIIDVPGHERFVRNMMAGASGIDFVALIIAADEGVMPQTVEHLQICKLLGIKDGLVVVTKTDMVEPDWLDMVCEDIRTFLHGTFLENSALVCVSNRTNQGMEQAKTAISAVARRVNPRSAMGRFRLPVDRIFTIKGFGTVVTGTVISGSTAVGEMVELLPATRIAKIRGLQFHDTPVERIYSGQRAAINFQGVDKDDLSRGDTIAEPGSLAYVSMINADYLTTKSGVVLKHRARIRLHLGAMEVLGRIIIPDREELLVDEQAMVQFRLEQPIACLPGDRFIVRSYSPITTIGGGTVIESTAFKLKRFRAHELDRLKHLSRLEPKQRLVFYLKEQKEKGLTESELILRLPSSAPAPARLLTSLIEQQTVLKLEGAPPHYVHKLGTDKLAQDILSLLKTLHTNNPLLLGISREELRSRLSSDLNPKLFLYVLDLLQQTGALILEKSLIQLEGMGPKLTPEQQQLYNDLLALFRNAGVQPPLIPSLGAETFKNQPHLPKVLALLLKQGHLVKISEQFWCAKENLDALQQQLTSLARNQNSFSVTDFKNLSGVSRKYAVPLLEYFDRIGLTKRVGDSRIIR